MSPTSKSSDNLPAQGSGSNRLTLAAILVALVNFGLEWNDRNRDTDRRIKAKRTSGSPYLEVEKLNEIFALLSDLSDPSESKPPQLTQVAFAARTQDKRHPGLDVICFIRCLQTVVRKERWIWLGERWI